MMTRINQKLKMRYVEEYVRGDAPEMLKVHKWLSYAGVSESQSKFYQYVKIYTTSYEIFIQISVTNPSPFILA